jgi:hypothetical protein
MGGRGSVEPPRKAAWALCDLHSVSRSKLSIRFALSLGLCRSFSCHPLCCRCTKASSALFLWQAVSLSSALAVGLRCFSCAQARGCQPRSPARPLEQNTSCGKQSCDRASLKHHHRPYALVGIAEQQPSAIGIRVAASSGNPHSLQDRQKRGCSMPVLSRHLI